MKINWEEKKGCEKGETNQLAGLVLHNSALFLSHLFLKQHLHSQSSVGCLAPPCFALHSVRSGFNKCTGGRRLLT